MAEKEFRVNKFLSLKLKGGKSHIYVGGKKFRQCKYLFLINPQNREGEKDVNSIDEAAEKLSNDLEEDLEPKDLGITSEEMFLGHCSNIQAWVEHGFDTRLLHSNLAFPLLKRLTELGVKNAEMRLKEEIFKRLETKYVPVINYLIEEGYTSYLDDKLVLEAILPTTAEFEAMKNIMDFSKEKYKLFVPTIGERDRRWQDRYREYSFYSVIDAHIRELELRVGKRNKDTFLSEVSKLPKLKHLDINIYDCSEKEIDLNIKMESVERLEINIYNDGVDNRKKVSDDFTLTHYNETKLTGDFGNFPNLKKVKITGTGQTSLENIVSTIGRLKDLKELHLNYVKIKEIPESFKNLKKINVIETRFIGVKRLPSWINELNHLKRIFLVEPNEVIVPEILKKKDGLYITAHTKKAPVM